MSDSNPEELVTPTSFYDFCYQQRLKWTKKQIPIRYKDKDGFYMPGYLGIVPKQDSPEASVSVTPAYLPIYTDDKLYIKIKNIFPSNRRITKLGDKDLELCNPINYTGNFDPPMASRINETDIMSFFTTYPSLSWTLPEVASAINCQQKHLTKLVSFKDDNLDKIGSRRCIITSSIEPTYKLMSTTSTSTLSIPKLQDEYYNCQNCSLGVLRAQRGMPIVFGRGNENAKGIIIGEAPGAEEERYQLPFYQHAPAGNILARVMHAVGLNQDTWYLTNSVICRPAPKDSSRARNGKPEKEHIQACNQRLKATLATIDPKIVVLVGKPAYEAYFGEDTPSGKMGPHIGWINNPYRKIYLTWHPSYVCRKMHMQDVGPALQQSYLSNWQEIADMYKRL